MSDNNEQKIVDAELPPVDEFPHYTSTQPADQVENSATETEPSDKDEVVSAKQPQNIGRGFSELRNRPQTPDKGSLYSIQFPAVTASVIKRVGENMPPMNLNTSEAQMEWYRTHLGSLDYQIKDDVLDASLRRPGTLWTNAPEIGGKRYLAGTPPRKETSGGVYSGDEAIGRISSYLDLGDTFTAAMWHSGWWASFRPPSEDARIELNRLMAADKIELGRATYGQIFSNLTVYTVGRVLKMACDHLHATSFNVENFNSQTVLKYLAIQDIHPFIWAFVCTTYPDGFDYERACMNDPTKCTYVSKGRIDIRGMQRTSITELTDWQRQHMTYRMPRSRTVEQVNQYREELKTLHSRQIRVRGNSDDGVFITLKSPTALEHLDAGHQWISSIVEMIEDSLSDKEDNAERNQAIAAHGRATQLLQFSHWVESISFGEHGKNSIIDAKTIHHTLGVITADDDVRENFFKEIKRYTADTVISLIGIPVYNCPNCETPQDSQKVNETFAEIIPLDMVQCFFELHNQAMGRIMNRLL